MQRHRSYKHSSRFLYLPSSWTDVKETNAHVSQTSIGLQLPSYKMVQKYRNGQLGLIKAQNPNVEINLSKNQSQTFYMPFKRVQEINVTILFQTIFHRQLISKLSSPSRLLYVQPLSFPLLVLCFCQAPERWRLIQDAFLIKNGPIAWTYSNNKSKYQNFTLPISIFQFHPF